MPPRCHAAVVAAIAALTACAADQSSACDCSFGTLCDDTTRTCRKEAVLWVETDDGERLATWVALPAVVPPGGAGARTSVTPRWRWR